MESFEDIKSLWQTDRFDNLPQVAEIESIIHKYSQKEKQRNILVMLFLSCIIITLFLMIRFDTFKMWSTYLGLIFFTGIALNTIYLKLKKQHKLADLDTLSNNDFLMALEKEENQACIGKSRHQKVLFIIWFSGFSFYIYEFIYSSINSLLIGYGALLLFSIVMWFFYIPFITNHYKKNILETINHINHLKAQFNDDN